MLSVVSFSTLEAMEPGEDVVPGQRRSAFMGLRVSLGPDDEVVFAVAT
jgi:hypothetical protein